MMIIMIMEMRWEQIFLYQRSVKNMPLPLKLTLQQKKQKSIIATAQAYEDGYFWIENYGMMKI